MTGAKPEAAVPEPDVPVQKCYLGLPLGLEAAFVTPNGVNFLFLFFSSNVLTSGATTNSGKSHQGQKWPFQKAKSRLFKRPKVRTYRTLQLLRQGFYGLQVIETLTTCAHIEPWAARAAGLVFAQYFWFRHCFLLTGQQGQLVQQLVVTMLSDKKLEVQDLAASSLSGLSKHFRTSNLSGLSKHFCTSSLSSLVKHFCTSSLSGLSKHFCTSSLSGLSKHFCTSSLSSLLKHSCTSHLFYVIALQVIKVAGIVYLNCR